ncbi:MAG: hypothetical protein LCH93_11885 [Proteobacteria bacterium]|nr:hypothetical protein [Pseudomonadota bacterium]
MSRSLAAVAMAATAWAAADTASASDRELRVVLDRLGCSPARIVAKQMSAAVTLHEVTCRGSGRVVQVACLEQECWPQIAPRDDRPGEKEEGQ